MVVKFSMVNVYNHLALLDKFHSFYSALNVALKRDNLKFFKKIANVCKISFLFSIFLFFVFHWHIKQTNSSIGSNKSHEIMKKNPMLYYGLMRSCCHLGVNSRPGSSMLWCSKVKCDTTWLSGTPEQGSLIYKLQFVV